jgi:CubicO group peptidase (beta-lactamase class C family)
MSRHSIQGGRYCAATALLLLLSGAFFLNGCRSPREDADAMAATAPAPPLTAAERIRAVGDRLIAPRIAEGKNLGMVVGVLTPDGQRHIFAYGRADTSAQPRPLDGDTIFAIASLSKPLILTLLASLVADGTMDYDETVGAILPEQDFPPTLRATTIRELATHTSGLPREPPVWTAFTHLIDCYLRGRNVYGYMDNPEKLYATLRRAPPDPADRGTFQYSNFGFGFLGLLIERKTGRDLADLLEERVCRPLGLADTGFAPDAAQIQRLAAPHAGQLPTLARRNAPIEAIELGPALRACGGIYASTNDILAWAEYALAAKRHPAFPPWLAMPPDPFPRDDSYHPAIVGWLNGNLDGHPFLFQLGMTVGYGSYLGFDPEHRIAVVLLRNNTDWPDDLGHRLLRQAAEAWGEAAVREPSR